MKLVKLLLAFSIIAMSFVLTGCDELGEKRNHGGNMQPYHRSNGQYTHY